MSKIIRLTFLLALAVTGCQMSGSDNHVSGEIGIGSTAPDFLLRDIMEKKTSLGEYRGRAILLTFWNMKCKDCVESMPSLEALNRRFKGQGLEVVSINADNLEYVKPEKIINFIKSKGYTFNVLFDETFSASESYKILAVPMSFLIDKNGAISFMKFGKAEWMSDEHIEKIQYVLRK